MKGGFLSLQNAKNVGTLSEGQVIRMKPDTLGDQLLKRGSIIHRLDQTGLSHWLTNIHRVKPIQDRVAKTAKQ